MNKLKIAEFGNPVLRQVAKDVKPTEIVKPELQELIKNMKNLLIYKKLGVGLAAPQVGVSLRLSVIAIRPSEHRPKIKSHDLVIINPEIIQKFGKRVQLYEGCISGGSDKGGLFAKVPRYKKLKIKYYDQKGEQHTKTLEGLVAHVVQHEIDHLNGVLFVDQVKDPKTYLTYKEYLKYAKAKAKHVKSK